MKYKIKEVTDSLVQRLSQWDNVEVITCTEAVTKDYYDPYFSITLDVYYKGGTIPPGKEREAIFSDTNFFEYSTVSLKDRFMMNDMPVRIEYKSQKRIENILESLEDPESVYIEKGTYTFHRLEEGIVLFEKTNWLKDIREKLENLPDIFWAVFRDVAQSRMEHYLSDLSASVFQKDNLYYKISMAGFLKSACCTLFAINKKFEPSGRSFQDLIGKLSILPAGFMANFDVLLRMDDGLSIERNREVAELLAKGIIGM